MTENKPTIKVKVQDACGAHAPIAGARVLVSQITTGPRKNAQTSATEYSVSPGSKTEPDQQAKTDQHGRCTFKVDPGTHQITVIAFVESAPKRVTVTECDCAEEIFNLPIGFDFDVVICRNEAMPQACSDLIPANVPVRVILRFDEVEKGKQVLRKAVKNTITTTHGQLTMNSETEGTWFPANSSGTATVMAKASEGDGDASMTLSKKLQITLPPTQPITGDISVNLNRTRSAPTPDQPLWTAIRSATEGISFNNYKKFMDHILCGQDPNNGEMAASHCEHKSLPYPGVDAYSLVKCATEVFLMSHCGVVDFGKLDKKTVKEEQGRYGRNINRADLKSLYDDYLVDVNGGTPPVKTLPYLALIRSRLGEVPLKPGPGAGPAELANCFGILRTKLEHPCLIELIWSYWHEEGMLVQTMKAISMRFQNKRGSGDRDPLMRFDVDPLRPLGNFLWGYIQDEQHRLTIPRRLYEYAHHYGLTLQGRAVPELRAVDSRSKFLEAFHNLLYLCTIFFKADDDTTKIADGFPVMNAIREVHLLLAEGAHNQFGDLPSTARQEMLIEQWLLARPEMREFLGGRIMVPYSEVWMDRVDTVKRVQGWTDTTITDFHDLAVFGEQLLLSIRWGHWSDIHDPAHSANWARYWRPEIQSYNHSYRAVTGIDVSAETTGKQVIGRDLQPSVHLQRRLEIQQAQRPGGASTNGNSPRRQGVSRNGANGGQSAASRPASSAPAEPEKEFNEDF